MTGTAPAGIAVLTLCAAVLVAVVRLWPGPSGAHRRTDPETTVEVQLPALMPPWSPRRTPDWPEPAYGAAFTVAIRHCEPCAGDAAVVVHACGAHTCDQGHTTTTTKGD